MHNRYIRAAAITSKAVNALSWQGEVFFRRLLHKVDDFGRYTADHELLRVGLFPRQLDTVRVTDIPRLLTECENAGGEKAGLLFVYAVDGKPYLVLNQWEKGRAKSSKYPDPPPDILKRLQTFVYTCEQMRPSPAPSPSLSPPPSPSPSPKKEVKDYAVPAKALEAKVEGMKRSLSPAQFEIARLFEDALGPQWLNDAGKWIQRVKGLPDKCRRVVAEVVDAKKNGRIKPDSSPAQYAEYTWKTFSS